jgi:kynureninase
MTSLADCRSRDAQDPLRALRDLYALPAGVIYLDGNSLGPLPKAAPERIARAVREEWGEGLIRSWNSAGWYEMPRRIGDKIATLVGAGAGEVLATDSTSNQPVQGAERRRFHRGRRQRPARGDQRTQQLPHRPYIAEALCRDAACPCCCWRPQEIPAALNAETGRPDAHYHVNYRTAHARHAGPDAAGARRRRIGGLGPVPQRRRRRSGPCAARTPTSPWLRLSSTSMAVPARRLSCGSTRACADAAGIRWRAGGAMRRPFAFTPGYEPAAGVRAYLCGTQPILSMTGLGVRGLDTVLAAEPLGGMAALRRKSLHSPTSSSRWWRNAAPATA